MNIFSTILGGLIPGKMYEDNQKSQKQAKQLMNEQIKAYKEQTELTKSEVARKRGEELAQKRRIDEKTIRTLRRNYRARGFLGTQGSTQPDMSNQLGG